MKTVELRVVIINTAHAVVRVIETECYLDRSVAMPEITIWDRMVTDHILNHDSSKYSMVYYDPMLDRFNFKCDVKALASDDRVMEDPVEICFMEIIDSDGCATYILMQPGMWHYNGYGTRFRMCDDAMLNVVAHQYIKEEVRANALVSDTFMKQFISIMDDVLIIPPHDFTEDDADEDDEDDDDDDDFEDTNVLFTMIYAHERQIETKDKIRTDIETYLRFYQPDYKLVKINNDSTESERGSTCGRNGPVVKARRVECKKKKNTGPYCITPVTNCIDTTLNQSRSSQRYDNTFEIRNKK